MRFRHLIALCAVLGLVLIIGRPGSAQGPFTDIAGNPHAANIEAIAAAHITLGCDATATLYCPRAMVTRAQMATFLARALGIDTAGSAGDVSAWFSDVGGVHAHNVDAVAGQGITLGCDLSGSLFCPDDAVSRQQMASFLARAFDLDASGHGFTDVGRVHEPGIGAISGAGITLGCNADGTLFCPTDAVPRDQMASFLARALGIDVDPAVALPPADAGFDYQIGGDYSLPVGVSVVSRDWFIGEPAVGAYSICYVNAFQTQADEDGVDRPDEKSNWPPDLVLTDLDDDPNWTGEYLINISTAAKRQEAAAWVEQMVDTCHDKGFEAVEFDNLDSWTRFDGVPSLEDQVPFEMAEAVAYATLLTEHAHSLGLASAQKNTSQLIGPGHHVEVGFEFALVEQCGEFDECGDFTAGYGDAVLVVEYTDGGFATACAGFGGQLSIVRRDVGVTTPGDAGYVFDSC